MLYGNNWYIKNAMRIKNNNQPDKIMVNSQLWAADQSWRKQVFDTLLVGTHYYYIFSSSIDNNSKRYVGHSGEGLNYIRTNLPDSRFESNTQDQYLDTASTYLNVPYIWQNATFQPIFGEIQTINKTKRNGYIGTDCSGLVNWTLLKNGNPLNFDGVDSIIVGNNNSQDIWEQKQLQGFGSTPWGAWIDGVIYFLDTNDDYTVDHVGFWYDDGSIDGQTIHAVGGDISRVVFSDLDQRYHGSWLYDAVYIYDQIKRGSKNDFVKK